MTILLIKIIKANFFKDYDIFTKMDPFCVIRIGNKDQQTSVKQEAGMNPIWNQSFRFNIYNTQNQIICISAYDQDPTRNQFIGYCQLKIKQIKLDTDQHFYKLDLKKGKKTTGNIQLSCKYLINIQYLGKLQLTIDRAILTRDTQLIAKMHPYVRIYYGDRKEETVIKKRGGKLPIWNQYFQFTMEHLYQKLLFEVYDRGKFYTDLVATGFCIYDPVCYRQKLYSVNLYYNDQKSGYLIVRINIEPK